VKLVLPKAVDVRRLIRTDGRQDLVGYFLTIRLQSMILDAFADTEYWLNWTRHFGPISGLEKLKATPIRGSMGGRAFDFSTSAYLGLALFMQSLMNDLRSLPVRLFLSARFLQAFILSF
jgi:hypothetical protein